jgi:Fe-S-cluster containining protein
MNLAAVVQEANASIGQDYCAEVCGAKCCMRGYVFFKPEYVNLITQGQPGLVSRTHRGWSQLSNELHGCPSLSEDNSCMIHDEEGRPPCCIYFPLKLVYDEGKPIVIVQRCDAVNAKMIDEYLDKLRDAGAELTIR